MSSESWMYLVRHGATDQNDRRPIVLQGHGINGPLNANGLRQANAVAEALAARSVAAVYASPMRRAQMTAELIAARHGLSVVTLEEIHEVDVGTWEGKSWAEVEALDRDYYARFTSDPAVPYRGGESYVDVLDRVRPVLDRLLTRHAGEKFIVVAHNVVNRVYLTDLLGIDLQTSRNVRQMNCCVNIVRQDGTKRELLSLNSVLHLPEV